MTEDRFKRKFDQGKLRFSLVPAEGLEAVARVLEFGAVKYAAHSWRHVPDGPARYFEAIGRHFQHVVKEIHTLADEDTGAVPLSAYSVRDEESGLPALAHLACDALFLCALISGQETVKAEEVAPTTTSKMPYTRCDHGLPLDVRCAECEKGAE